MGLVFPEIKNNAPKSSVTHGNEAGDSLIPTETTSYEEWETETQNQEELKKAIKEFEKEEKKSKKNMAIESREKRERAERYTLLRMGRLIQNNIIAAGRITETVFKALRDDRPPEEIALAAVKGLSLLVNDTMLYDTIEKKYRKEYGITLDSKPPYNIQYPDPGKK